MIPIMTILPEAQAEMFTKFQDGATISELVGHYGCPGPVVREILISQQKQREAAKDDATQGKAEFP